MKSTRSAFELYSVLLSGVLSTLYAVLKSFYSSKGKLPWNIDTLVSVSSMVVTTGLGSWISSLSKSCWNLAGFWGRTEPTHTYTSGIFLFPAGQSEGTAGHALVHHSAVLYLPS